MTDPRDAADGPPSVGRRDAFADRLGRELDASRLAWDAAILRSDAALASGDADSVRRALDDHRLLLEILEARIGEVVATADASTGGVGGAPELPATDDPTTRAPATGSEQAALVPTARATGRGNRWVRTYLRASALVGAAAAVALVVVVGTGGAPAGPDATIARTDQDAAEVERRLEARTAAEEVRRFDVPVGGSRDADAGAAERSLPPLERSATAPAAGATEEAGNGRGSHDDAGSHDQDRPPTETAEPDERADPEERLEEAGPRTDLDELFEPLDHDAGATDQDVASSGSVELDQLTSELAPRTSGEPAASDPTTGLR